MHGVHSPFLYQFNRDVMHDSRHFYAFESIAALRKKLETDKRIIHYVDHGAGSHKANNSNGTRQVSAIAKNAARQHRYGKLLFNMVNQLGYTKILELGTSLGIGTCYLALANSSAHITTIEGSETVAAIAQGNFDSLQLHHVKIEVGTFDEILPSMAAHNTFDLVVIDGNHSYEATKKYFDLIYPCINEGGAVVLDDIHWSKGMQQAWQEIIALPSTMCAVDVFQFGIVFKSTQFKDKTIEILR